MAEATSPLSAGRSARFGARHRSASRISSESAPQPLSRTDAPSRRASIA